MSFEGNAIGLVCRRSPQFCTPVLSGIQDCCRWMAIRFYLLKNSGEFCYPFDAWRH